MTNYIRPSIRQRLIEALVKVGISTERAERVSFIPEAEADNYLKAHANICAESARNLDIDSSDSRASAFLGLSYICIEHIIEEIYARGISNEDFPRIFPDAAYAMAEFIKLRQKQTKH